MENDQSTDKFHTLMIFGIIGPIVALSFTMMDVFLSHWFSWRINALNDLGVHPYSYLFNSGLVFMAICNILFVMGLWKLKVTATGAAVALGIAGLSLGLVGIFNENHPPFHLIFAMIYFIIFPMGIMAFSSGRRKGEGYSSALGYVCAAISIIFILVGILQGTNLVTTPLGLGFYELVEAVMLSIWIVYTSSYYFMRKSGNKSEQKVTG